MSDREKQLLATMVYEAVRFSSWAVGEGITPVAGEPAIDPGLFLSDYVNGIEGDDYEGLAEVARDAISAAPQAPLPELDEDDPVVLAVARGIAEHGFARPWDDFLPLNVHDTDQSDLIDYAKAAIASMPVAPPVRSAASTVEPVAWRYRFTTNVAGTEWSDWFIVDEARSIPHRASPIEVQPLYAAPATSPKPPRGAYHDIRDTSLAMSDNCAAPEPDAVREFYICYDGHGLHYVSRDPAHRVAVCYDEDAANDIATLFNGEKDLAALSRPAHGGWEDTKLLDALRDESWDLRCFDMPTGGGDADIGWRVIGHWQAKPQERVVGEAFHDDPRAAIREAIARNDRVTSQPDTAPTVDIEIAVQTVIDEEWHGAGNFIRRLSEEGVRLERRHDRGSEAR